MAQFDRENVIAFILANRAYLYGLFHVVFGSEPSQESVEVIFGDETRGALADFASSLSEDAKSSVQIAASGLKASECLSDAITSLDSAVSLIADDEAAFVDKLRMNYTPLFLISGDMYVCPWESPYTGKEAMTFQISTLDVRTFYHEAGYKLQAEKHFPDDHIAAMMDFMSRMAQSTYDAFADERDSEAIDLIKTQCDFIDKHLLTWIDKFADAVNEKDSLGFYRAYALAMDAFVHVDRERLTDLLSEIATFSENV